MKEELFRLLPQVGELLASERFAPLGAQFGRELLASALREELDRVRESIRRGQANESAVHEQVEQLSAAVRDRLRQMSGPSLRRVLNATGVILQTNLGRAPLSAEAVARVADVARGYCNLELDLESGERSRRDLHVEQKLLHMLRLRSGRTLPDKAAAVVNNCAAATLLALNTLAEGGEVIVSRGELVEIGGGFRVPDILRKSGAVLREVGTTNRTRIADYSSALTQQTRCILRVHRSNFRMEGFTEQPSLAELVELGQRAGVPVFEDQGTGVVADLERLGCAGESSWLESAAGPLDLVAASGDKLFGGPQCGLLVGERQHIERVRANPLFRALRVDKLNYAALEATLDAYLAGREATLPIYAEMFASPEILRSRCEALAAALGAGSTLAAHVCSTASVIGGGTTPGATLPSFAVALAHPQLSPTALAAALRRLPTPVVPRVQEDRVLLDLRTILPSEDAELAELLLRAFAGA